LALNEKFYAVDNTEGQHAGSCQVKSQR